MKPQTLVDDPNLKVPAAVRAAAARADELISLMQAKDGVTVEGNLPDIEPAVEPAVELVEALAGAPPDAPAIEAPPATAPTLDPNDATWEQKAKSHHGRLIRAEEKIRDMTEHVQNLQNIIANLQAAPPPAPAPMAPAPQETLLTNEEVEEYGKDLLSVVGKKAREELAPVISAYEERIKGLEAQVQATTANTSQQIQQKLLDTLDTRLPTWREVNTDEKFIDWLGLPDAYSGAIRMDMLKAAYAQGNAPRVLAFFNGFLAEEAAVAPGNAEPDDSNTTKVAKVPLSTFAAPGRAKTAAAAPAPAEKPIFTRAQIAKFYTDVSSQVYRGRDAEKNKLEAQIFEAQREGRIR
jgi:TolA-binding protein